MALIGKSSKRASAKASFAARQSPKVKTGKDGGKNLGTPTHCTSTRAHGNVRSYR